MSRCPTCNDFVFSEYHRCPPEWEVRDADDSDDRDWSTIRARDEEEAAAKYAEACDDDAAEGAHERVVLVREKGSTDVKRFEITFDYSVDYTATEKEA